MKSVSPQGPAEALAPEAGLLGILDPISFGNAVAKVGLGLLRKPRPTISALARLAAAVPSAGLATLARMIGLEATAPIEAEAGDRRFDDPAWQEHPGYFFLLETYLLWSQLTGDLVKAAGLDHVTREKAEFACGVIVDALAPTNFLPTNPAALKKAFDTAGLSVLRGLRNFADDLLNNGGWPRTVDTRPFVVGENLAATPGRVVYRNALIEVIQYEPQTETVFEIPILMSPPWINKFYILDLAPGRSFIEWAAREGHTVFALSYRNPDEPMRDVSLEDYLIRGPRDALDVVTEITGAPQVNIVGLCLGGTLTAMLLAHMAAIGDDRIRSATLLNSLIDFTDPGPVRSFVDPKSVERISKKMSERGYLEAQEMDRTFRLLRGNDLVWNYVVNNWLMGEDPPAFDLLAWGADGTRMPAAMHSFYLRSCYIENSLAQGSMEVAGTPLRLDSVIVDTYLLACAKDHIVPWKSAYASTRLLKGDVHFVLGSSGHIAGLVNPPSLDARHWTNASLPKDPDAWREGATEEAGSWWEDWAKWIAERSGEKGVPPTMGSKIHPPLADAPGEYVREK